MHIHELGHVVLYVTNIERMAEFYRDTLGFKEVSRSNGFALFSGGRTHHELLLIEVGGTPQPKNRFAPGLYHMGFKVGEGSEVLKEVYRELKARGVKVLGTTDHTVTHSIYIEDPDGNELELYTDVSDVWRTNPDAIMTPPKYLDLEP